MTRDVHYDDRRHTYTRIADGQPIPSATGLLKWAGKVPESARSEFFSRPYLERGKRIHRATLALDAHVDPRSDAAYAEASLMLPTDEEGYLLAYGAACSALDPEWVGREVVRSWRGLVGGTVDGLGWMHRMTSKPYAVIDVKSGPKQKWHRWQLALYALMDGNPYALRIGVHLQKDGRFTLEAYTDGSDLLYVTGLITRYWRAQHAKHADDSELDALA